jgi:hypothetical protein
VSDYRTWLTRVLAAYGTVSLGGTVYRLATISCSDAAQKAACQTAQHRGLLLAVGLVVVILAVAAVLHVLTRGGSR